MSGLFLIIYYISGVYNLVDVRMGVCSLSSSKSFFHAYEAHYFCYVT